MRGWPMVGRRRRVHAASLPILLMLGAGAATNATRSPERIPPLRPPKTEIPPSFWEAHGLLLTVAVAAGLLVLVALWRLLMRREPELPPPPAQVARTALAALRDRPVDAELLGSVSRILRDYFIAALGLPVHEYTNTELGRCLESRARVHSHPAVRAAAFLEGIEPTRFDPNTNAAPLHAVEEALELVEQTEQQLRAAERNPAPERVPSAPHA